MTKVSTFIIISLVLGSLIVTAAAEEPEWPVKRRIDLSSGFGDFRLNRFHTGIDLRTGGREGERLYAPVDGYIYRIKMSYTGYGKGLYLMGTDGHIYVFGHLKGFTPKIDTFVKNKQREIKRYYLDVYPDKTALPVKKGDLLGYTGQTGAGAPHLHFERRSPDNIPLNPLKYGYRLEDKIAPTVTRIGLKLVDDRSLFPTGTRQLFLEAKPSDQPNRFTIDTVVYLNSPFGLVVESFDQMRTGGMKQAVYKLRYYVDDELYYSIQIDTINFDWQRNVGLEYDFVKAVDKKEKQVRRLFQKEGNIFPGSISPNNTIGIWGNSNEPVGIHRARIVAEDCFGNSSTLEFPFLWGARDTSLFVLDSTTKDGSGNYSFFFTPQPGYENLELDSVAVFLNRGNLWGQVEDAETMFLDNGQLRCTVAGYSTDRALLRLIAFRDNCIIRDNIFNGIIKNGKRKTKFDYLVVDDGLILRMEVQQRLGSEARFDLYNNDELLGTVYPQMFSMMEYQAFVPANPKYEHINKIEFVTSKNPEVRGNTREHLNFYVVGHKDNQQINLKNLTLTFNRENFYEPRFIELQYTRKQQKVGVQMTTDHYHIIPKAFVCKSDFDVSIEIPGYSGFKEQMAVCWWDEEDERWVWLDSELEENHFTTKSTGGGTFTVKVDVMQPEIVNLSITRGLTYRTATPKIEFSVVDTLSGMGDDSSFLVKLDGDWIIPEYDPERRKFSAYPNEPLGNGQHHLSIEIWDKAGNKTEQYLKFMVAGTTRRQ